MKGKIIKGIVSVYVAVSLVYGGVKTIVLSVITTPSLAEEIYTPITSTHLIDTLTNEIYSQIELMKETAVATSKDNASEENITEEIVVPVDDSTEDTFTDSEEESDATVEEENDAVAEVEAEAVFEEEYQEEPAEEYEEVSIEDDEEEEEEYVEPEPTEYVPSLYEYLSQFSCGSCRRYCSLCNPRCHTGVRKAENAEYDYYEIYGDIAR